MPAGLASTRNAAQALALASVLAGCALDSEAELRSEVAGWTSIAETIYFASERNCSAALYRLTSGVLRTQIRRAESVRDGLALFERGVVVVFDIEGQTPSATSEALMLADRVRGTALMASGLLGGNCYPDGLQAAYSMALNNPESVVVFDAARNTLGILDAANKRLFVTRGAP